MPIYSISLQLPGTGTVSISDWLAEPLLGEAWNLDLPRSATTRRISYSTPLVHGPFIGLLCEYCSDV